MPTDVQDALASMPLLTASPLMVCDATPKETK
jgi:hypothetical protein